MPTLTYTKGAALPDAAITWNDGTGSLIKFATGWTFSAKVGVVGSSALFTKSSGITGADTDPNLTIVWAASGEVTTLTPGSYQIAITATRVSDSKLRKMYLALLINDTVN